MQVFKWEVKRNFKSFVIWSVFIIAIQFMYSALFPSFAGEGGLFSSKMRFLPKAFLKIFGVDHIDFGNILHFFAMQGQIWIFLFATFYLTKLSSSMFVKEEHDKTAEFVLSRPISRKKYVVEKFLSVSLYLILYDSTITFSILALFNRYKVKPFDTPLFLQIALSFWAVHIFMTTVGTVFSIVTRRRNIADTGSLFILGFFYVLSLISRVYEKYGYNGYKKFHTIWNIRSIDSHKGRKF